MNWSRFDLGVGVIALEGIDLVWNDICDLVDVIEVEPQTVSSPFPDSEGLLADHVVDFFRNLQKPILCHNVGNPVGGTLPPDHRGIVSASVAARQLRAVHWSEHLAFNRTVLEGKVVDAGFLLPPIQGIDSLNQIVDNVQMFREQSSLPFLLETPVNYLRHSDQVLADSQFLTLVASEADCGILLDLHNLWANERNGRETVEQYLSSIPLERVWEVHVAGGFELDGFYLDAHFGRVSSELLEIARISLPRLPNVRALIFEAIPESLITIDRSQLRELFYQLRELTMIPYATGDVATFTKSFPFSMGVPTIATAASEAELVAFTTRVGANTRLKDPGAEVLRTLTDHARLSSLTAGRAEALRKLITQFGPSRTEKLLAQFLTETPVHATIEATSAAFDRWKEGRWPDVEID